MVFFIIILLIVLNAFFSLAEIALVTVKQGQLKDAAQQGNRAAQRALDLVKDPEQFLSAVQVGITLLSIVEGIYGGDMVARYMEPLLVKYMHMAAGLAHVIAMVTGIGLITYFTIVLGELIPKSIALQVPLKVSIAIAPSLHVFTLAAYPFVKLLTVSTQFILRRLNIRTQEQEKITENELKRMLSIAYRQGVLERSELLLHENIFSFNDLTARRMMKPAKIVIAIDAGSSRQQVEAVIRQRPYSHFPVYTGSREHITGVLTTKDFFIRPHLQLPALIRPATVLPVDMPAADIFLKFRTEHIDFGLVMHQGKFLGIVTMQDIMEGVFGDIPEREDFSAYFFRQSAGTWVAEGFIHLQLIRRKLGLDWLRDYEAKYINLTELLTGELGHEPVEGDELQLKDVVLQVTEAGEQEVGQVVIRLPAATESSGTTAGVKRN